MKMLDDDIIFLLNYRRRLPLLTENGPRSEGFLFTTSGTFIIFVSLTLLQVSDASSISFCISYTGSKDLSGPFTSSYAGESGRALQAVC